ncbi:hypothetical protein EDEG_00496 [Edhazardia aedis USNM 41457]|uniref:Uncharacterized protein n=1 Tax=Edhazardia aedis (strain USNM 41457) TaxID=1003232 RepID=J9D0B2_EDHAE|nr:hypothetical protein EDEG_00496 [Edhazardia aedis USNM 41457]|eukprot:EJW01311.1 hypothetical protein EDEG_00496 [Edhazardia aedis USNM 41457]
MSIMNNKIKTQKDYNSNDGRNIHTQYDSIIEDLRNCTTLILQRPTINLNQQDEAKKYILTCENENFNLDNSEFQNKSQKKNDNTVNNSINEGISKKNNDDIVLVKRIDKPNGSYFKRLLSIFGFGKKNKSQIITTNQNIYGNQNLDILLAVFQKFIIYERLNHTQKPIKKCHRKKYVIFFLVTLSVIITLYLYDIYWFPPPQ